LRTVIEAGRHAAEVQQRSLAVTDHRVRGVDDAIGHGAGQAEDEEEQGRGEDGVGEILGHGLHGGRGDLSGVEGGR
jgi:hypothetical protein